LYADDIAEFREGNTFRKRTRERMTTFL